MNGIWKREKKIGVRKEKFMISKERTEIKRFIFRTRKQGVKFQRRDFDVRKRKRFHKERV